MRKRVIGSLAILLIGSSVAWGQAYTTPPPFLDFFPGPIVPPNIMDPGPGPRPGARVWGNVEFLLWRFKDAPLAEPLVSSGFSPPAPAVVPEFGDPVLFGGQGYSSGWRTGTRLTVGGWLDCDCRFGLEASGFYIVPKTPTNFAMGTNNPGVNIAIPFNNVTPGGGTGGVNPGVIGTNSAGQSAFLISGGQGTFTGNPLVGGVSVTSTSSLWGAELNGIFNLYRSDRLQLNMLYGFRYVDLLENLNIYAQTSDPTAGSLAAATFSDHFGTHNQFYGGQLGLKGEWTHGLFFVNATGKVALGVNHETINIDGSFSDALPVFTNFFGSGPGGLFAQRSNIGQYSRNRFMVLPETELQVGMNLGSHTRLFAGYDFLYMGSVLRPGNQIDPNINLSQFGPNSVHGPNLLTGPASPGVPFQSSSFWAQGVTFGVEFRY